MKINLSQETKGFLVGFVATVAAGIVTMYIFYNYMQDKSAQIAVREYQKRMDGKGFNMLNSSKLKLDITTYEYYNDQWNPVLTHTFYGNTEEEISQLITSHRSTDSFFDASFNGEFKWKEGIIKLKNEISDTMLV